MERSGGFAKKLSHQFSSGIPDLFIALPLFMPCIIEVKDLGEVVDNFDRQFGVTPLQHEFLKKLSECYGSRNCNGSGIFVAVIHRGCHRLVAVHYSNKSLTAAYENDPTCWVERQIGGHYDVASLLQYLNIGCAIRLI